MPVQGVEQGCEAAVTNVRIYRPSKTAMQSGMRKTHKWIIEFEPGAPRVNDPLMGWIGSSDTQAQIRLRFDSREEAVSFADRNGLTYRVVEPHQRIVRPKSYAENFRA
ncbi:MAG: ETC complex I subunit [Rhodospirillales bacterium]